MRLQPLRWLAVTVVAAWYRLPCRIRAFGRLPSKRGPTLIVINHQHEIESPVVVADLTVRSLSWRYPIFTVSSRRLWEPGFFAERLPWLALALRGVNLGPLVSSIGMQPIENELHTRPFASLASDLRQRHGDLAVEDVFRERALGRLGKRIARLSDILRPRNFNVARARASLTDLREPYRAQTLEATRRQLDADIAHFATLQREGATIFLAPEGFYTEDGRMQRLRGILPVLAPLAKLWIVGISYDPFAGRRLALLYRVIPAVDGPPIEVQIKAARPVTVSAVLATWLRGAPTTFTEHDVQSVVVRAAGALPPALFVEPGLRADPARAAAAALRGLERLRIISRTAGGFRLTGRRTHPSFSHVTDIIAHQANFHEETLDGASRLGAYVPEAEPAWTSGSRSS